MNDLLGLRLACHSDRMQMHCFQVLALVGSGPALGNWDAAQAVRLSWREGHRWVANVQLEPGWHGALEFKV